VATLPLSAVGSSGRETSVTNSADLLVTLLTQGNEAHLSADQHLPYLYTTTHVVLVGQNLQRGLDDTTSQSQDQVQSRLLLDVVVGQSSAIFELLSGENQSLLVRGDSFLVLNLFQVVEVRSKPGKMACLARWVGRPDLVPGHLSLCLREPFASLILCSSALHNTSFPYDPSRPSQIALPFE
jgi:hypothetical protein